MMKSLFEIYAGISMLVMIGSVAYFGKKDEIETAFRINIGILMITVAIGAVVIISSGINRLLG